MLIIANSRLASSELVRMLHAEKHRDEIRKVISLLEIILKGHFFCNIRNSFLLLCIAYMAKCTANELFQKDNYFEYSELILCAGFILEVGTCAPKCTN